MPTHTVKLTPELDAFVDKSVANGHFQSADEVFQAALQMLERDEKWVEDNLEELRAPMDEGDASGVAEGNSDQIIAEICAELGLSHPVESARTVQHQKAS